MLGSKWKCKLEENINKEEKNMMRVLISVRVSDLTVPGELVSLENHVEVCMG